MVNLEVQNYYQDDDHVYAYVTNNGRGCWWNIDLEGFDELPDVDTPEAFKKAIIKHMEKEDFDPAKLPCIENADPVLKQLYDNLCQSENNMWFVDNDEADYEDSPWMEDFNISKDEYIRRVDAEIEKYHLQNVIEKYGDPDLLYTCYSDLQCRFSESYQKPGLVEQEEQTKDDNQLQKVIDSLEEQASTLLEHIRDIKDAGLNYRAETASMLMKDAEMLHDEMAYYTELVDMFTILTNNAKLDEASKQPSNIEQRAGRIERQETTDLLADYPNKTLHSLNPDDSVARNGLEGVECSVIKHDYFPEQNMRCLLVEPKNSDPIWVTYTNLVIPCKDPLETYNLNKFGVVSQEQLEKIYKIYSLEYSKPRSIEEYFADGFKPKLARIDDMNCVLGNSLHEFSSHGLHDAFDRFGSIALTDENLERLKNIIPDSDVLERDIFRMSQKVQEIAINKDADTVQGAFSRGFLGNEYDVIMSENTYTDNRSGSTYPLYDVIDVETMKRVEASEYEFLSVRGMANALHSDSGKKFINDRQAQMKMVNDLSPLSSFAIGSSGRVKVLDNIVKEVHKAIVRDTRTQR